MSRDVACQILMYARIQSEREADGLDFTVDAVFLERAEMWNLVSRFERLDVSYRSGGNGVSGIVGVARGARSVERVRIWRGQWQA